MASREASPLLGYPNRADRRFVRNPVPRSRLPARRRRGDPKLDLAPRGTSVLAQAVADWYTVRMPRACAYCRTAGVPLTREHVLNAALAREFLAVDEVRGTVGRRAHVARDVCRRCNNDRLSWLDRYGAQLNATYFSTPVSRPIDVTFKYEFKPLVGWLVKCAFNHARWQGLPAGRIRPFVPYLLGTISEPPTPVTVFLGIIAPAPTQTAREKERLGSIMYPEACGVGPIRIAGVTDELLIRFLLSFQSYVFAVLAWPAGTPLSSRRCTLDALARKSRRLPAWTALRELRPTRTWARVTTPCMDVREWFVAYAARRAERVRRQRV